MDAADRDLFELSLRHAVEHHTGAALDVALAELGWPDALATDPADAVSLLFGLQGAANATSSALDLVLLDTLGLAGPGPDALGLDGATLGGTAADGATLDGDAADALGLGAASRPAEPPGAVARGAEATGAGVPGIVLPALGRWTPPGGLDGGRLTVAGLGTAALAERATAVVVTRVEGHDQLAVVPTAALDLRPIAGIDPALGLVEVAASRIELATHTPVVGGIHLAAAAQPSDAWDAAVARARLAVGHELVGASRTMLALAREHALDRIQFGQPIAMFQAVRHRLADTLIAIETAEAVLDAAWLDGSPGTAAMAKAQAGRAARTAARHCQQVLAGIGFTTEHDLHRYVRRILVLDELFGSARVLTRDLGDDLLASRQLPALLPL
jgi:hypothetical protein